MTDLTATLIKNPLKSTEAMIAVLKFFGSASQVSANVVQVGPLAITYGARTKKVGAIKWTREPNTSEIERLVQAVETSVYQDHGHAVGERIVMSGFAVNDYFRFGNEFQILPVPESAPRPSDMVLGYHHPAMVQYKFQDSSDLGVRSYRSSIAAEELLLLLNVLIPYGIRTAPSSSSHRWVYNDNRSDAFQPNLDWEGYFLRETWTKKDSIGFYEGAWNQFPRRPAANYYSRLFLTDGDRFDLPEDFETLIRTYYSLSEPNHSQFRKAAYWLSRAQEVGPITSGLSVAAMVMSLEALLPDDPVDKCESCGQDKWAINKRFKEFLRLYVPGLPPGVVADFYAHRCKISHGKTLLASDDVYRRTGFAPERHEADRLQMNLRLVARLAIIGWLRHATKGDSME